MPYKGDRLRQVRFGKKVSNRGAKFPFRRRFSLLPCISTIRLNDVDDSTLYLIFYLTQQLRLASVRVVEAVCLWRKDIKTQTFDRHYVKSGTSRGKARGKAKVKLSSLESKAVATSWRVREKFNITAAAHEDDIQGDIREPKGDLNKAQSADRMRSSGVSAGKQANEGGDCGTMAREMWVVTMMVPGIKLWGPSSAMGSKYKRFCRGREDLKIEKKQV